MTKKRISVPPHEAADVPSDSKKKAAVLAFWEVAIPHRGVAELRKRAGAASGNSGRRGRVG